MSDKPKPFDRYPEDHPLFGRLFQFEGEWLKEIGDTADSVTPRDLGMFNAGFRRGIAACTEKAKEIAK